MKSVHLALPWLSPRNSAAAKSAGAEKKANPGWRGFRDGMGPAWMLGENKNWGELTMARRSPRGIIECLFGLREKVLGGQYFRFGIRKKN